MARPTTTTSRSAALAASATAFRRATLEAKVVTATRPLAAFTSLVMVAATSVSEGERPSRTALVESPISASTPASPSSRNRRSSVGSPMIGVGSIFQSPVCSTVPTAVWMASACDSGIEWATGMNSTVNGPSSTRPPDGTTVTGIFGGLRSEAHLASNSAALNWVA